MGGVVLDANSVANLAYFTQHTPKVHFSKDVSLTSFRGPCQNFQNFFHYAKFYTKVTFQPEKKKLADQNQFDGRFHM